MAPTPASSQAAPSQDSFEKVFAIPEICGRIARSLDRTTLTSCSRVSREWNASWLPILWRTIDAGKHWRHPAFQEALGRHGDLIRILECSTDTILCRNLVTLVLPKTTLANQADHVRLIRQNPHLRNLSVSFHDDPSSQYSDLVAAISGLRLLRKIAFDENKTLEVSTLEAILRGCNSSLQELSLKDTYFLKHPFNSAEEFASGLLAISGPATGDSLDSLSRDKDIETKEPFGILSLCMDGVACLQDLLLNLGSRFPLLSRLSLRKTAEVYFSWDFSARLAQRCPKIKHLDISETEDMDDEAIARFISSFPGLQNLQASDTRFGNKSLATLVNGCRDLAVLDITATSGVQGQLVQQLLEKCTQLRELNCWDVSTNVVEMMLGAFRTRRGAAAADGETFIAADGSIIRTGGAYNPDLQGQWMCRGLESLSIRFDYDPSPLTIDEQRLYPVSRARQFVYEQLSKLTGLKYLAMEAEFYTNNEEDSLEGEGDYKNERDDSNNNIWIDFSLRSGLETLAPLKNLHTLSYSRLNHKVGMSEIQWMSKNWPNLRLVNGLDEDEDSEIIEWLEKNRPDIDIDDY
ncbi:hypothetical protein BGZ98_002525 [Dissophora globulifera]|nr:hypothetical protein BGZ98_002525 [Dissophora globulifera]